jgi:twitching motility protein PilT
VASQSIRETIRSPEHNPPLKLLMEKGLHPYGMQTFALSVSALRDAGVIDDATADAALAI